MIDTCVVTLLLVLLALVFLRYPMVGICGILFLSVMETSHITLWGISWNLSFIGLTVFLFVHAVQLFIKSKRDLSWFGSILFLGVSVLISSLFSKNPVQTFRDSIPFFTYLFGGYLIGILLDRQRDFRYIKAIIAISVMTILSIDAFSYFQSGNSPTVSIPGSFSDWSYISIFFFCLFPFLLFLIQIAPTSYAEIRGIVLLGTFLLIVVYFGSLSTVTGVILLGSFTILALGTGLLNSKHLKYLTWLFPLFALGFLHTIIRWGGIVEPIQHMANYLNQTWWKNLDFNAQIDHGFYALNVFREYPFFGVGYGQMDAFLKTTYPTVQFSFSPENGSLFTFFAETGLFGGLAFVWLFVNLIYPPNSWEIQDVEEDRWLLKAGQVSGFLLGLSSLFYAIHIHLFTFCLIGILWRIRTNRIDIDARHAIRLNDKKEFVCTPLPSIDKP